MSCVSTVSHKDSQITPCQAASFGGHVKIKCPVESTITLQSEQTRVMHFEDRRRCSIGLCGILL